MSLQLQGGVINWGKSASKQGRCSVAEGHQDIYKYSENNNQIIVISYNKSHVSHIIPANDPKTSKNRHQSRPQNDHACAFLQEIITSSLSEVKHWQWLLSTPTYFSFICHQSEIQYIHHSSYTVSPVCVRKCRFQQMQWLTDIFCPVGLAVAACTPCWT